MPGCLIAMARLNRPAIMVYGGTIRSGHALGRSLDIISAFQAYGEYLAGSITDEQRGEIVRSACPALARAAACTRPTRWPWPLKRSAWHCPTARRVRPTTPANLKNAAPPAQRSATFSNSTSSRATS